MAKHRDTVHIIDIPTFQKHWIYDRPYGHDIVIAADTGKTIIQCRWTDRERSYNGRVSVKRQD